MVLIRVDTATLLPCYCFLQSFTHNNAILKSLINIVCIGLRPFSFHLSCFKSYIRPVFTAMTQKEPTVIAQGVERTGSGCVFYQTRELMTVTDPDC